MNFTSQKRYNPKTGRDERYYRLKESYRNALGRSCTRILLNVCFIDDLQPEEMRDISLAKKGGTKKRDAVLKRIGKLEGKYPSIARYYQIDVQDDGKGKATEVGWQLKQPDKQVSGTYFLRTNVKRLDEKTTWDYYNLIREIECTNRQTSKRGLMTKV